MELKELIRIRYPKISLLAAAIISAYILFGNQSVEQYVSGLGVLGYLGVFIAGMMFAFGFTAPFAVGFFIILNPQNIWLAGVIGGMGALISDLAIFRMIRFSFMDEFKKLENTKLMKSAGRLIERSLGHKIKLYLMYSFAGILIASPLPDEAGVTLLSGLTKISATTLAIISFTLNTLGIILILSL